MAYESTALTVIFADRKKDGQKQLRADICFQDLQIGEFRVLSKRRHIFGHWLYVTAMRLEDGDLLIVATDHAPYTAVTDYAKR